MKDIIIDENEERVLMPEELEKIENEARDERLKKAKRRRGKRDPLLSVICKVIMGLGLFGMVISMLFESGTMMTVCLAAVAAAGGISYFFFRDK